VCEPDAGGGGHLELGADVHLIAEEEILLDGAALPLPRLVAGDGEVAR
jgi:hypothetical protein